MLRWLLPALFPSWRFFDVIGPSPRIELRYWQGQGRSEEWRELLPPPRRLRPHQVAARLLWNPARNEALFFTRCAERVLEGESAKPLALIEQKIRASLPPGATAFQFRILVLTPAGNRLGREIVFESSRLLHA